MMTEGAKDEAELVEEIVDYLGSRGLSVSRVMQVIRRTSAEDLVIRWPGWRRNCDTLLALGFSPDNVTTILHGSSSFLHELDSEADIRKVCFYLWEDLGFESWGKIGLGLKSWQKHKYKVVTQSPEVLRTRAEVSKLIRLFRDDRRGSGMTSNESIFFFLFVCICRVVCKRQ